MAIIGTIYNKSSWANFNDFNINNGWAIMGGKLVSPADISKPLQRTYVSALDANELKVIVNSSGAIMEIHGIAENNQHMKCSIVGGYATCLFTYNSAQTQSATPLSITGGDLLEYKFTKVGRLFTFTVTNLSTSLSVSVVPDSAFYAPSWRVRMYSASSFTISSISYSSNLESGGLWAMGDSITAGFNADVITNRWASLSGLKVEAGPGDTSLEMLGLLPEVFTYLKPRGIFMAIGTNDQNIPAWRSNMLSLRTQIEARNIGFVAISPYANNYRDMSGFKTYIEANFDKNIDFYTPSKDPTGWGINPTYDIGDGVHFNTPGHAMLHDEYELSPWHDYVPPTNPYIFYAAQRKMMSFTRRY